MEMAHRSRGTVASKAISPARSRIKSKNGWIIHLRASHLQGALGDVKSFLTPRWFPVFFHHKRTSAASRRDRIFSRFRVFIHVLAFLYKALSPLLLHRLLLPPFSKANLTAVSWIRPFPALPVQVTHSEVPHRSDQLCT